MYVRDIKNSLHKIIYGDIVSRVKTRKVCLNTCSFYALNGFPPALMALEIALKSAVRFNPEYTALN